MDKQPSVAAMEAAKDLLAAGNFVRYMGGGVMVNVLPMAHLLDAYAAELARAARQTALEQACQAVEQAREWARTYDTPVKHGQVLDYLRGMDKAEEYIRALSVPDDTRRGMDAPTLQNTPPIS